MVAVNTYPFSERFQLDQEIKAVGIQTGDIFFRRTDSRGPGGLPFSAIVAHVTNSEYDHASIAIVENNEIYLVEVNDRGTLKYRLLDWLDYCVEKKVEVHTYTRRTTEFTTNIELEINKFLALDPEYDFTYGDPAKFYCTESVATIYEKCGIRLMEPKLPSEVFPSKWSYYLFVALNWLSKKLAKAGFDLDKRFYFVGNKKAGLAASPMLKQIYKFPK